MKMTMLRKRKQKKIKAGEAGFTLVELIVAVLLLSLLGTFVVNILGQCLSAQSSMQVRKEHSDDAIMVLHQMSKEIMEATSVGTGVGVLTLTVDGVDLAYNVNADDELIRTIDPGGIAVPNVMAGDVESLNTSVEGGTADTILVNLLFNDETVSRDIKVFARNR